MCSSHTGGLEQAKERERRMTTAKPLLTVDFACPVLGCGARPQFRECYECGAAGNVTDCGHLQQPRPLAPGRADGLGLDRFYCTECAERGPVLDAWLRQFDSGNLWMAGERNVMACTDETTPVAWAIYDRPSLLSVLLRLALHEWEPLDALADEAFLRFATEEEVARWER